MKTDFFIRYDGRSDYDESRIILTDLGKSLVSFDTLLKDLGRIFRIQTDVEVVAVSHHKGSYIVDLILQIHDSFNSLPIDSVDHLLEFLKIASDQLLAKAYEFFGNLKDFHKSVNDFGAKHPVDIALLALIIPWLFNAVKKQRNNELPGDPKLSERIAKEFHKIIVKNRFGDFIVPVVNESVKSIEVSSDRHFRKNTAKIDDSNFEEFLGKDTEILSELEDGKEYQLRGEITSLKSTRGDSLTFQYVQRDRQYNLDLIPPSEKTTKDYTQYYKEIVVISASVSRTSLFKKPKLHLIDIDFYQKKLNFSNKNGYNRSAE